MIVGLYKIINKDNIYESWRDKEKLRLLHADICGPIQIISHDKSKYFFIIYK